MTDMHQPNFDRKPPSEKSYYGTNVNNRPFPLLLLPLEIRFMIYEYTLISSRRPSAEDVYEKLLHHVWKDTPSPLLQINQQVRAEICEFLRRSPFTMRITWQDQHFDALALSAFISQQRRPTYDDMPHLIVEIWPPHPERPIDAYYIYERLRLLRNDLRAASNIPKVDLVFLENSIATWSDHDGKPLDWLGLSLNIMFADPRSADPCADEPMYTDIGHILDLFERLDNVETARVYLPDSLSRDGRYPELRKYAEDTENIMMNRLMFRERNANMIKTKHWKEWCRKLHGLPEDYLEDLETLLKSVTAEKAIRKLKKSGAKAPEMVSSLLKIHRAPPGRPF